MSNEDNLMVLLVMATITLTFILKSLARICDGIHRIATVLEELDKKKEGE